MTASTQQVLDHHLQSFSAGDLDAILSDFADASVIIVPNGVHRTRQEKAEFFTAMFAEFGKPGMSFSMEQQVVEGDTAYIRWSAETADNVYEMGSDTFVIRDGKIISQTLAVKTTPKA